MYVFEDEVPVFGAGESAGSSVVPFFSQPNPARAFVTALQTYLGVPATGAWDKATHDALAATLLTRLDDAVAREARIATYGGGLPPWGTNVDGTIALVLGSVLDFPTTVSSTAEISSDAALFIGSLGLPTTSAQDLAHFVGANQMATGNAKTATVAYIRAAEAGVAIVPGLPSTAQMNQIWQGRAVSAGVVAGVAAVVGTAATMVLAASGRKKGAIAAGVVGGLAVVTAVSVLYFAKSKIVPVQPEGV